MSGHVCPECGLDFDTISPSDAKVAIRSFARRYRTALAGALEDDADEGLIRRRPDADTWSALEYAVHVADRFELFGSVLARMNQAERPAIGDLWDADQRAEAERYAEQDPAVTLDRLDTAAGPLAKLLDRVDADGWAREATFTSGVRDLLAVTREAVHEGSHHLRDVDRVLEAARRR